MCISILCTREECYADHIGKNRVGAKMHQQRLQEFEAAIFSGRANSYGESVLIKAWHKYDLIKYPGGRFIHGYGATDEEAVDISIEDEALDYSSRLRDAGFEEEFYGNISFFESLIRQDRERYESRYKNVKGDIRFKR